MGMGLFGKLFEKKICSICGGEIGLLGNRRLADGNLCKKCAQKLSPWFDERRESTVAQIDEQLRDRERNLEELRGFSSSREVGNGGRLMIDEAGGRFVVLEDADDDLLAVNPDLVSLAQVERVELEVEHISHEEKRMIDGKKQSYEPPRFLHYFDFWEVITTSHPWAKRIRFRLNGPSLPLHAEGIARRQPHLDAYQEVKAHIERPPAGLLTDLGLNAPVALDYRTRQELDECDRCCEMHALIRSLLDASRADHKN